MGEIVSNTKFFVDTGAGSSTAGSSKLLTKCKSADVKDDRDVEVVLAVGVDQGAGFRDKNGGGEITLSIYRETGKTPEADWRGWKADRKVITFTIQDENNGQRESFRCRVAKIDSKDDESGSHEDTVTLKYTKRYKS
jgi:hypothetical protein